MKFRTLYTTELECILSGLPERMIALPEYLLSSLINDPPYRRPYYEMVM